MPNITKRELIKISNRIQFMYEQLGGQKKDQIKGKDEFEMMNTKISEDFLFIRKKIEETQKNSNITALEQQECKKYLNDKLDNIEQNLNHMEKHIVSQKNKKIDCSIKEQIYSNLKDMFVGFNENLFPQKQESNYQERNVIKLDDLKQNSNKSFIDFESEEESEFLKQQDQTVLEKWDVRDIQLDEKLGQINDILEHIKSLAIEQRQKIEVRDELIVKNKDDALKVNIELEKQNQNMGELLQKMRSPSKFCVDICLLLVLMGLISVIIKLVSQLIFYLLFRMHKIINGRTLQVLEKNHPFLEQKIINKIQFPLNDELRKLILMTGQTIKGDQGFYTKKFFALSANQVGLDY